MNHALQLLARDASAAASSAEPANACLGNYIDVGANDGTSVLDFYRRQSCSTAPNQLRDIKKSNCYWAWPWWLPLEKRRQFCAHVFEPNPRYATKLRGIASGLERQLNVSIQVHSPVALSTEDGEAPFGIDNATMKGVGSSLVLEHRTLE